MSDSLRATLSRLGLSDFYDVLAANDVDANLIDDLTEADLRDVGLTLGERKRFLRALAAQKTCSPPTGQSAVAAHTAETAGGRPPLSSRFSCAVWAPPSA